MATGRGPPVAAISAILLAVASQVACGDEGRFGARATFGSADSAGHSAHREVQFVSEYIRALSEIESIRADAEQDSKTAKSPQERLSACVHTTRLQMHAMVRAANLTAPYKLDGDARETPGFLVNYYATKGEMFRSLGNMCQTMLQGPKPGLDHAAAMPKLGADIENLDKSLPLMSVMVFNALISPTPDKAGHMSRLIVTKQERDALIHQISFSFRRLDAKDANYAVSAATVLWEYLARKGYRCADEPAS